MLTVHSLTGHYGLMVDRTTTLGVVLSFRKDQTLSWWLTQIVRTGNILFAFLKEEHSLLRLLRLYRTFLCLFKLCTVDKHCVNNLSAYPTWVVIQIEQLYLHVFRRDIAGYNIVISATWDHCEINWRWNIIDLILVIVGLSTIQFQHTSIRHLYLVFFANNHIVITVS